MKGRLIVLLSFLLLFIFFTLARPGGSAYVYGDIPPGERAALIALYKSTDGDNWKRNYCWKTPPLYSDGFALPGTENNWYGITCNQENTMVTLIELKDNRLVGSISPELGNLSGLTKLNLSNNQLMGTIPLELKNLSELTILNLHSNQLTGKIPSELGTLGNLQDIDLYSNQLTGGIPSELGTLGKLQNIDLYSNQLTGEIPSELGNLLKLQYLGLNSNQLTGEIPSELGKLSELICLYLDKNHLEGAIPTELGQLSKLEFFYLNSNKLIGRIPYGIKNLKLYDRGSDFRWNGLYTDDEILKNSLNKAQIGGNWESTQTIAPENVTAHVNSATSVVVGWERINYIKDKGGYRVFFSLTSDGPYTLYKTTGTKYDHRMEVTGLDPNTKYYFVVQTWTEPHDNNENTVESENSIEASAKTLNTERIISGRVTTAKGKGVPEVILTFSPPHSFTVTDENGNYRHFVELHWSGKMEPSKTGYTFDPTEKEIKNITTNQPGNDFQAIPIYCVISGKVTDADKNEGIEGVTLTFSQKDGTIETVTTGPDGYYTHEVFYGWIGRVTPSKGDLLFEPPFSDYSFPGVIEKMEQDYRLCALLTLNPVRRYDKTLIIKKVYGKIELDVHLSENASSAVQKFIIYRKETGGSFQVNKEFFVQGQKNEWYFSYNDEDLEKDKNYAYSAKALDANGKVIGESKETNIVEEK